MADPTVDEYLAALPADRRGPMAQLRATIRAAAPDATEVITYNMPGLKRNGRFLVSYDAFKRHYSLFPSSDPIVEALGDRISAVPRRQGHDPLPGRQAAAARPRHGDREDPRRRERREREPPLASPDPRRTIRAMSAPADPAIVVEDIDVPGAAEILTPDALAFVADLQRRFSHERIALPRGPPRAPDGARRRRPAGLPRRRPPTSAPRDWRVAPAPAGPRRPAGRDHRPGRAEDDDQRPQLAAPASSWPTSRTRSRRRGRTSSAARRRCATRSAASSTFDSPGGQGVPPERRDRDAARPAARLAPRRAPRARRRRADLGQPVRLRAVLLPQRRRAASRAAAARTSTCPSWRATTRRGSGTTSSSTPRTALGIPRGTIRATVLIETILAAFEMDEILYELRDHAAGPERRPLGLPLQRASRSSATRPRPGRCRIAPS